MDGVAFNLWSAANVGAASAKISRNRMADSTKGRASLNFLAGERIGGAGGFACQVALQKYLGRRSRLRHHGNTVFQM